MTEKRSNINRRRALKALAATAGVSLAGCSGQGDDGDGGDGGSGGMTESGDGGSGETTESGDGGGGTVGDSGDSEWPDLSGQSVHLLIDENSAPFRDLFNRMAADFTQATGAQVNNEYAGVGSNIEERAAQLIQAGDPPEILFSSGGQSTNFANAGILASTTEVIEYWEERWGSLPEQFRVQVDGEDVHLPTSSKGYTYWHRTDIDGFSDGIPGTWDEYREAVATADGQQQLSGTYIPKGQGSCPELFTWGVGWANGASLCERSNGEVQIAMDSGQNRTRWIEALEYLGELSQYSPAATDSGCGTMYEAVPGQQAASTAYTVSRPKAQSIDRGLPFAGDVRGAVPPMGKGEITSGNSEGFVLFDTENVQAGREWMKFLSKLEYQFPLYEITPFQIQPIYPGIRETDRWQQFLNNLPSAWSEEDINAAQHREYQIPTKETSPPNPYAGSIRKSQQVVTAVYEVAVNDMDPEQALTQTADELRNVLSSAKEAAR
jgi:ABC-type glycerol-3-phosphate transport system substrate-binding protein